MKTRKILTLTDIFLQACKENPDATAIICNGVSWTYQELYEKVLKYAHVLVNTDLITGTPGCIAIYGDKTLDTAAVIFAVLLLGYAYMPLDITLPAERLQRALNIAKPQLLVTTQLSPNLQHQFSLLEHKPYVVSYEDLCAENSAPIENYFENRIDPEQIAYLLFTSGSTGLPKGVCVSHRAAVSALTMFFEHISLTSSDKIACQSAFCYDLSMFDLFTAFYVGAHVHIIPAHIVKVPQNFIEYIIENALTSIFMVNSALDYLLKYSKFPDKLLPFKHLLLTGDPFTPSLKQRLSNLLQADCEVWNLYSAVEMPYAFAQKIDLNEIHNEYKHFNYVGSDIHFDIQYEQNTDEAGALVVQSPVLFSGYVTNSQSLQDVMQNPVQQYNTGDAAFITKSGIKLMGRLDRQVKVMGNRIELDDIEINLESLPTIKEAAVCYDSNVGKLFAFVVPAKLNQAQMELLVEVKSNLSKLLPTIMHPHEFIFINAMPRTTSGKKDRKLLTNMHLTTA